MGLCYMRINNYDKAADHFQECQDFARMMMCLEKMNNYDKCLKVLKQSPHF